MIDNYEMIKHISLLLILFSVIIIFVHTMPGKIARSRHHPQAEAIEITSLLGLLVFPLSHLRHLHCQFPIISMS